MAWTIAYAIVQVAQQQEDQFPRHPPHKTQTHLQSRSAELIHPPAGCILNPWPNVASTTLNSTPSSSHSPAFTAGAEVPRIQPVLDRDAILAAAAETRGIVTAEEHHLAGGLGGAVAE